MKINSTTNIITSNSLVKTKKPASFKKLYQNIIKENYNSIRIIEGSLQNKNYNFDNLLKIQFHTGLFFFREQIFCKAAELSASSLKSITQMHI